MSSRIELSLIISELDFGFGNKPCMLLFVYKSFFLAKKPGIMMKKGGKIIPC